MGDSMSTLQDAIANRFRSNALLQAPILSQVRQNAGDLSTEHPPTMPSSALIEGARNALEQGNTHYAEVPGIPALREHLAHFVGSISGTSITRDQVMVTAGLQESRFLAVQVLGDALGLLALPTVVHPGVRLAAGVRPLAVTSLDVDQELGLLPSITQIEHALAAGARLLYLESPSRLTGARYDVPTVQAIAALITRYDAAAIWDQGQAPWVTPGDYTSIAALPNMAERSVLLGEAYPGVGLESLAIAYLVAQPPWLAKLTSQKQAMSICTSTPAQFAALAAADEYAHHHARHYEQLAAQSQTARERAHHAKLHPIASPTVNILALKPDDSGSSSTLTDAGFTVADGTAFGAPGVIRLAMTFDTTTDEALDCLAAAGRS